MVRKYNQPLHAGVCLNYRHWSRAGKNIPAGWGGPGGSAFTRECSGDFVNGIYVRAGDWVDAIGLKCGIFNQTSGKFNRPAWNTPFFGGGGGTGFPEQVCASDRFVSGIRFNLTAEASHPFVDFIELTCTPLGGGAPNTLCIATPGTVCPSGGFVQTCPAGDPAAIGIRGRTGVYVDALGLICGPKPATIPPSAQQERPEACPPGNEVPDEWKEMLNAHNERRRQHCVPPLAWSNTLQKEAQAWADQCKLQHEVANPNGENLAWAFAEDPNGNPILPALTDGNALQTWYCEVDNYKFDNPVWIGGKTDKTCKPANGHFTQIVWRELVSFGLCKSQM